MASLIPVGAVITLIGLGLLMVCILRVGKARKAGLPEEELRGVLEKTVPLNLAALLLSALGLIVVVVGIILS
jgi:hypothetical protein